MTLLWDSIDSNEHLPGLRVFIAPLCLKKGKMIELYSLESSLVISPLLFYWIGLMRTSLLES